MRRVGNKVIRVWFVTLCVIYIIFIYVIVWVGEKVGRTNLLAPRQY